MSITSNALETVLLDSGTLGVVLAGVVVTVLWANRAFVRDIAEDSRVFWHRWSTGTALVLGAALTWIGTLDDWMQLVTAPYRSVMRYDYQRTVTDPVDPDLRIVSLVLLGVAAIGIAGLFARHIGGLGLQVVVLVTSLVMWMPLYIVAQRMNLLVIDGFESSESWAATAGVTLFWIVRTALSVTTILVSLTAIAMLLAPAVTIVLGILRLRVDAPTDEADAFYAAVHGHALEHEDVPLAARWRPIRRPV